MNKFSGIDLHSNNAVVVVSDETDRVVYERRLRVGHFDLLNFRVWPGRARFAPPNLRFRAI
jgi:hypothetical protein